MAASTVINHVVKTSKFATLVKNLCGMMAPFIPLDRWTIIFLTCSSYSYLHSSLTDKSSDISLMPSLLAQIKSCNTLDFHTARRLKAISTSQSAQAKFRPGDQSSRLGQASVRPRTSFRCSLIIISRLRSTWQ
jgi:hypothetical protein